MHSNYPWGLHTKQKSHFLIYHSSYTFTGSTHVNIMYLQGASDVAVLENFRELKSVSTEYTLNIYSKDGKNVCTLMLIQVKFNPYSLGPAWVKSRWMMVL